MSLRERLGKTPARHVNANAALQVEDQRQSAWQELKGTCTTR
jgi:hypothetical protein